MFHIDFSCQAAAATVLLVGPGSRNVGPQSAEHAFSMPKEAEYPSGLCTEIAAIVKSLAIKQVFQRPSPNVNDMDTTSSATARTVGGGILVHALRRQHHCMEGSAGQSRTRVLKPVC